MSDSSLFRRDKRSPNENMAHVLKMGALTLATIVLLFPQGERFIESNFMPKVPIIALAYPYHAENGEIRINYYRDPQIPVIAKWYGQIRKSDDTVVYTGQSPKEWPYSPDQKGWSPWKWGAWWENDTYPSVPDFPFKLCIRYEGRGQHGSPFGTEYVCSDLFDPAIGEAE